MSLINLTIHESADKLAAGEITSVELCQAFLSRIDEVEDKIKAIVSVDKELILAQAAESDKRRTEGALLTPYDGVPVAIKDNMTALGQAAQCGSKILDGFVSPYDSTVVKKMKEAGLIIFTRANMDEFAMGSSTENSQIQKTKNPWNTDYVPGGSSGGSAAGVAAREFPAALGSDTGGSIRQPASFCGVVGMKPTYGRVSRFGLVAFASSLDQIGPITKDVKDSAIIMDIIGGSDKMDSTSIPQECGGFADSLKDFDVKGLKIGKPKECFDVDGMDSEVREKIENALKLLEEKGAEIIDVELPHMKYSIPTYYIIATAEASTNLARFDGVRYGNRFKDTHEPLEGEDAELLQMYKQTRAHGFGAEVKRRILLGTFVLSKGYADKYYLQAQKVRTLISEDYKNAFEKCDVILSPVSANTAFKSGAISNPVEMYLSDILTTSTNLAGICGMSVPAGYSTAGLPIGLQITAPAMGEKILFQTGHYFETLNSFEKLTAEC